MSSSPLSSLTVVDFSQIRAGPWCTQLLGILGADVIKVERPESGAYERNTEPKQNGFSAEHLARNRNKQSIAIDLKSEEGVEIARDLVADADVVVENFSGGTMESLGLGYETLREENPGLVYASIKGYGEKGPYADKKGVDLVLQAEAGIMSVTGPEGGPPVKVGQAIGDIGAGLYATIGILAALYERTETGDGQKIATDLFGTIVSFLEEYLTIYGMTGENPTPFGRRHQTTIPYEVVETKDGYVGFMPTGGEEGWETFVTEIIEEEELLKYDSLEARQKNYKEIAEVMHPVFKEKTTAEWQEIFDEYNFPNGPLNQVGDVTEHPQARSLDYVMEYNHQDAGEVFLHGHPLHFSNSETGTETGSPKLGEHTETVLRDRLGLSDETIADLRDSGVVEVTSD